MNPFEMRYAVFHTAKDILESQYKANISAWELMDATSKQLVGLAPKFPTLDEIIEKAVEINKFVSEANEKELTKAAKKITGF
jgi:hypothetical protein